MHCIHCIPSIHMWSEIKPAPKPKNRNAEYSRVHRFPALVLTPLKFFGQKKVRWALELKSITECWEESRWWRSLCGDKSFFFLHGVEPLPSSPSLPSFMSLHSLHKSFNLFGGKNNHAGLNLPQKETASPEWWGKDNKCFKSRNRTTMMLSHILYFSF